MAAISSLPQGQLFSPLRSSCCVCAQQAGHHSAEYPDEAHTCSLSVHTVEYTAKGICCIKQSAAEALPYTVSSQRD